MSEDCLFLNVVAPPAESAARAPSPVLVYIHAGEFHYGSGADRESDMPYFAPDAVLVTINYRIGIFGFLASEDLRSRSVRGGTGNYGVQDQRLALRWVRHHVASFGGNASNIILMGESSGGTSVAYHLVSTRSAGLFDRVIMESPGLTQTKRLADASLNYHYVLSALRGIGASPNCTLTKGYLTLTRALSGGTVLGGGNASQGWGKQRAMKACDADPRCIGFTVSLPHNYSSVSFTAVHTDPAERWQPSRSRRPRRGLDMGRHLLTSEPANRHPHEHGHHLGPSVQWLLRSAYDSHGRFAPTYDMRPSAGRVCPEPCDTFLKATEDGDAGVSCLLSASAHALSNVSEYVPRDDSFETDGWAPVVDGVDTKRSITQDINEGRIAPNVSVLLGSNLDEGTIFMYLTPPLRCDANLTAFQDWARAFYGDSLGEAVVAAYMPSNLTRPLPKCVDRSSGGDGPFYNAAMRSAGDYAISCRVRQASHALARRGHRVWEYQFRATPTFSLNYLNISELGAFHGAEVPFVFGDAFELKTDAERKLSAAMGCLWRNFAWSGDPNHGPNGSCGHDWPQFGKRPPEHATLLLGEPGAEGGIRAVIGLAQEQCRAFHPTGF
jgi:carboxylesterase type B